MAEAPRPDPDKVASARDGWLRKPPPREPAARMPRLAEAMVAVAEHWTANFCALSASEGEVVFKGLEASTAGALPERRTALPIFAALRIPAWGAAAGVLLDRSAVSLVVESLFGGGSDDTADDRRPVSPIEMRIVDVIGGQIATALTAGLKSLLPLRVEFDRTAARPEASFLGKPPTPVMVAGFTLRTLGRSGAIDVLLPLAALEEQADLWSGEGEGTPAPDQATWSRQLRGEVGRAVLRLQAEIALAPMTLGAIARLQVGQVLELPFGAGGAVMLRSSDERLFRCQLGQSGGFYTVRLDDTVEREPQPSRKTR